MEHKVWAVLMRAASPLCSRMRRRRAVRLMKRSASGAAAMGAVEAGAAESSGEGYGPPTTPRRIGRVLNAALAAAHYQAGRHGEAVSITTAAFARPDYSEAPALASPQECLLLALCHE
jgi:hypothetical protein